MREKKNPMIQRANKLKKLKLEAKKIMLEQKIYKKLERLNADERVIRWCLAREVKPELSEVMNYARNRDININSDKVFKIWTIVNQYKYLFEAL